MSAGQETGSFPCLELEKFHLKHAVGLQAVGIVEALISIAFPHAHEAATLSFQEGLLGRCFQDEGLR